MPERRGSLASRLVDLVGPDVLRVTDPGDGWPALGELVIDGFATPVALFVGPVTLGHRGRDEEERRFQNPGQGRPIILPPGRVPLLLGVWEQDPFLHVPRPLLALADARRREHLVTRFSVFVSVEALADAVASGWATRPNDVGELVRYCVPSLLPAAVAAADRRITFIDSEVQEAVALVGLTDGAAVDAPERARRQVMALVRDAMFSRKVLKAYGGQCAMCGLGPPLVQGAHIYPAAAEGSTDHPSNGIALCANHHVLFDRHRIIVHPETGAIEFHPRLDRGVSASPVQALIESTYSIMATPTDHTAMPAPETFIWRYRHFAEEYADWPFAMELAMW